MKLFEELQPVLMADLAAAYARLAVDEQSHSARRDVFRTAFAMIEGLTFAFRQSTLESVLSCGISKETLPLIYVLSEKTYQLDGGKIHAKDAWPRTEKTIVFTFQTAALAQGFEFKIETGSAGFHAFRKSVKVRNRITHPKIRAEMDIDDKEMTDLGAAIEWIGDCAKLLLQSAKTHADLSDKELSSFLETMFPKEKNEG